MNEQAARRERFLGARRDATRCVLEGLHAVKHARRFGADFEEVVARFDADLTALVQRLAPDLAPWIPRRRHCAGWRRVRRTRAAGAPDGGHGDRGAAGHGRRVDSRCRSRACRVPRGTRSSRKRRRGHPGGGRCRRRRPGVLGPPRSLESGIGAGRRRSPLRGTRGAHRLGSRMPRAAGGARCGRPTARRGRTAGSPDTRVRLRAPGPESPQLLQSAAVRASLPMREGVSSLNLATAVAAVLYSLRAGQPR